MAWTNWVECWGTYQRSSAPYNVAMGGSPLPSIHSLDLSQARAGDYGQGIRFNLEGTNLQFDISLVGYSIKDDTTAILNGQYVPFAGTYNWYLDWSYSTDGGRSYIGGEQKLLVASHASDGNLAYMPNWHLSSIRYNRTVNLPDNFTHVKVEISGEHPYERHQNIYTREVIIPPKKDFKPMAIRKSSVFKTLNVPSGFIHKRASGSWVDVSTTPDGSQGQPNQGTHRIRKASQWLGQNKIGS